MRKTVKRLFILCMAAIMLAATVSTAFAETIFYADGCRYTFINNEKVSLYGADEDMTELAVPSVLNGRKVVDIRNSAFSDSTALTSVDFSTAAYLERIGSFAFAGCSKLAGEVVIPENVELIETAAFQECVSLNAITFNAQASKVPNQCCYGCSSLSNVTLNENIRVIGAYAFANCPELTYVEIPASVESIDAAAFDSGITLGVYYGSYAQSYAESRGIPYVILDAENIPTEPPTEPPTEAPTEEPTEVIIPILGDSNGDGSVGIDDATVIQRHLADISMQIPYETLMRGDVDSDGKLSIVDATFIQRFAADMPSIYPINQPIA